MLPDARLANGLLLLPKLANGLPPYGAEEPPLARLAKGLLPLERLANGLLPLPPTLPNRVCGVTPGRLSNGPKGLCSRSCVSASLDVLDDPAWLVSLELEPPLAVPPLESLVAEIGPVLPPRKGMPLVSELDDEPLPTVALPLVPLVSALDDGLLPPLPLARLAKRLAKGLLLPPLEAPPLARLANRLAKGLALPAPDEVSPEPLPLPAADALSLEPVPLPPPPCKALKS